jgi:hypothetical protein
MNVKIATEAIQFPEKEFINGIFLAVRAGKVSKKGQTNSQKQPVNREDRLILRKGDW